MRVRVFWRAAVEGRIGVQGGDRERRHGLRAEVLGLGFDGGPGKLTLKRRRAERFAVLDQWLMIMSMFMTVSMVVLVLMVVIMLVSLVMVVVMIMPIVVVIVRLMAMVSFMFMSMIMIMGVTRGECVQRSI